LVNDHDAKIAKFKGEFVWHHHSDTDELFLILKGTVQIELEGETKVLKEGDLMVIKKGVAHKPIALEEAHVLMIEKRGTINTGNLVNEQTKKNLKTL
jgi:mannose-6-phosphate isomerase-like protein (cupin superfamily)